MHKSSGTLLRKIEQSTDISMGVDGWTTIINGSVYACNLTFPDRCTVLWDVINFSGESHTATNIAGRSSLAMPLKAFKLFSSIMPLLRRLQGPVELGLLYSDGVFECSQAQELGLGGWQQAPRGHSD